MIGGTLVGLSYSNASRHWMARSRVRAEADCEAIVSAGTATAGSIKIKERCAEPETAVLVSARHAMSAGRVRTPSGFLEKYSSPKAPARRVEAGPLVAKATRLGMASGPMAARETAQRSARSGSDDVRASRVSSGMAGRARTPRIPKTDCVLSASSFVLRVCLRQRGTSAPVSLDRSEGEGS